ncbi:hypothetical protein FRC08_015529 [Ceratobasidium sp. 394]|nr:hypothetical protein FRC08_015529 [Ceratobasidium sp. 394]
MWVVDAKPDGMLLDHGTLHKVLYLFWESQTQPALPLSPTHSWQASSPNNCVAVFDPSWPNITPSKSVVLSFDKVTVYIDEVLVSLGLHTEARCSFIIHWLPDLQQHQYIALSFLPQAEYEAVASLNVTPTPDVTTHVFMLFQGVKESQLGSWAEAQVNAAKDPSVWRAVVGVDWGKAQDASLFCVLEWGGMEVK